MTKNLRDLESLAALPPDEREFIDGLIDEFDAVFVESAPLCRFPSHRPSDWTNEGGRAVCGVCHPPVSPEVGP